MNAVKDNVTKQKVNFRCFEPGLAIGDDTVDVVLPKESVRESSKHYMFTLYGYFLGQRVTYPVV